MKRKALVIVLAMAVTIAMCGMSVSAASKLGTPKITKATATQTTVTLKWSKAKKADGYRIYRYNGKKYVKIKTLKTRTYTVKKLKAYTTYKFKVRAYNKVKITKGKNKGKYRTYYGNLSKVKKVKTAAAPVPSATVSDAAIYNGSTATFECKAATGGTLPYTYQWYKNGTAIVGATSETYTTDTLYTSDSGTKYTCRVTNPAGYIEATGTVTVNYVAPSRTVIKSWNIGSDTEGNNYNGSNGNSNVVATLYSDGELAVTGTGDTVVFGDNTSGTGAYQTPWRLEGKASDIKSATIASGVVPTNMNSWYKECKNLTSAPKIPTTVKGVGATFYDCTSLVNPPKIPENVTNMISTFYKCTSLVKAPTIPSSATTIQYAFYYCSQLTEMPEIGTGNVPLNMNFTFHSCTALVKTKEIPARVTSMYYTFFDCTSLTTAPDITKCTSLTDMNSTFDGCTALATGPSVIPASVTNMYLAFYNCKALTGTMQINANPLNYGGCFTNASTNAGMKLEVCAAGTNVDTVKSIIKTKTMGLQTGNSNIEYAVKTIGTWNIGGDGDTYYDGSNGTSSVVATLNSEGVLAITGTGNTVAFDHSNNKTQWAPWTDDTYKTQVVSSTIGASVTPTKMNAWYQECINFTTAPTIPSSVVEMDKTFNGCTSLATAPNLAGCTSLKYMNNTFDSCTALTAAPAIPVTVEEMDYTFFDCEVLVTGPSVIPASVTDMLSTFERCKALTGEMQINANPSSYYGCFSNASTDSGTNLTVYGSTSAANGDKVQKIIVTPTSVYSNINYGGLK